jgi:sulfotransferase family protein
MKTITLPSLLYIGADKAGSTSIAAILNDHPDVHVSPAKDTYYFTSEHRRGIEWYRRQFSPQPHHRLVAEVCHDYLYDTEATIRIAHELGQAVTLLVCLRDPTDRAVSSWLHRRKHGYQGGFEEATATFPDILDHGDYGTHLSRWFEAFRSEQIVVVLFDDLEADPVSFAEQLYARLGLPAHQVSAAAVAPRLRAAGPRMTSVVAMVKVAAVIVRRLGGARLIGRIKKSRSVQRLLYRPIERHPEMPIAVESELCARFASEVALASRLTGFDLLQAWPRYRGGLELADLKNTGT